MASKEIAIYGAQDEQAYRWKRVVDLLDRIGPKHWREDNASDKVDVELLGDCAVRTITRLLGGDGYGLAPITVTPVLRVGGYIVKRDDFKVEGSQVVHTGRNPYSTPPEKQSNYFTTLDEAQKAATEWAAKYKRAYTVYAVQEIGTAAPSAPPVSWTPKA